MIPNGNSLHYIDKLMDADRLDLGRVGITPDPIRLKIDNAKQIAEKEFFYLLEDYKADHGSLRDQ